MKTMKVKLMLTTVSLFAIVTVISCSEDGKQKEQEQSNNQPDKSKSEKSKKSSEGNPKGIGEVKNVELTDPLDENMIKSGKAIYDMKCASCHKLTDQRVVGPGWAGITNKRRPEWIMNMITNVEVMLAEDPQAQKLLEECLTRMPNQGVSIGDARDILEFMRKNDMEKVGSKDEAVK